MNGIDFYVSARRRAARRRRRARREPARGRERRAARCRRRSVAQENEQPSSFQTVVLMHFILRPDMRARADTSDNVTPDHMQRYRRFALVF